MTVGEMRREAAISLRSANAAQEAAWMLCALLEVDAARLLAMERHPMPEEKRTTLYSWLAARNEGKPLQYILGEWPFMGLLFAVREGVLIPREDSEALVRTALDAIEAHGARVLDLCTGSGAIAIAIGVYGNPDRVDAVDISEEACALAGENARRNHMELNVYRKDVLSEDFWIHGIEGERYDAITANPPYISQWELAQLDRGVREYEPSLALDGGADGLTFYRVFAERAQKFLKPGAVLLMEIGRTQGEEVKEIFLDQGWAAPRIIRDENGKDRVVEVRNDNKSEGTIGKEEGLGC